MARTAALTPPRARGATPLLITLTLIAGALALAVLLPEWLWKFPEAWNLGLRGRIDVIQNWVIQNRGSHPLFIYGLDVISNFVDTGVRALEDLLIALPWTLIAGLFAALGWLARGRGLAIGCAAVFAGYMAFGLWEPAMQTLALMLFSVLVALLIGVLIGIVSALNDRFAAVLQPVLDTMQTMPAFVYLIPVVLLFGIARVPAVMATVIYAMPPVIRLTNLGIREVQPAAVEAGACVWQHARSIACARCSCRWPSTRCWPGSTRPS